MRYITNIGKFTLFAVVSMMLVAHSGIHIFHPIASSGLSDPLGITDPGFPG